MEKHVEAVAKELGGKITVKAFTRFATKFPPIQIAAVQNGVDIGGVLGETMTYSAAL